MRTIALTAILAVAAGISLTACANGQDTALKSVSAASSAPLAAASAPSTPAHQTSPANPSTAAEPTFVYPGDSQCTITYRDRGDGSMSWTANVTVAGELITHASDSSGNIYSHDVEVTPGPNAFAAPVPLSQIDDIGGNLDAASGASYGCSVAPQR